MKRILFDDIFLQISNTGIGAFWKTILREIAARDLDKEYGLEILLLNRTDKIKDLGFKYIDFQTFDYNTPAADRITLTALAKDLEIDLFVSSYYTFVHEIPSYMMIYDFIPEMFNFDEAGRMWLERKLAILHSSKYLANSENTKRDFVKFFPELSNREVDVVYPGVDSRIFSRKSKSESSEFKKRFGLDEFCVMVGTRGHNHSYKNGSLIFDTIKKYPKKFGQVVFVGGESLNDWEREVCSKSGVEAFRLSLSDNDLAVCLSSAKYSIYPSLYEGFGLPITESLSVGTPVITCKGSSFSESGGNLAFKMESPTPDSLAHAIESVQTKHFQDLILEKGPEYAKKFNWEESARKTVMLWSKSINHPETSINRLTDAYIKKYTYEILNHQF